MNMATIRKAFPSDFPKVFPLLCEFNNSRITKEMWEDLFRHEWERAQDYTGYILEDDDLVVGYVGMLFSKRRVSGKEYTFCNLTSWIVKKEFRKRSIDLVMPLLDSDDFVFTDFSATPDASRFFQSFGYQQLAKKYHVVTKNLLPVLFYKKSRLVLNIDSIKSRLNDSSLRIVNDHLAYGCKIVLIDKNGEQSLVVLKKRLFKPLLLHANTFYKFSDKVFYKLFGQSLVSGQVPFLEVIYAENKALLNSFPEHASALCRAFGVKGIVIPDNFIQLKSTAFDYDQPRLYKGSLGLQDIDSLYSEIILLE